MPVKKLVSMSTPAIRPGRASWTTHQSLPAPRRRRDSQPSIHLPLASYFPATKTAGGVSSRRAIGAKKLNLWGISYGSHLGLALMKYHPASINKAVLSGIEGLDQTIKRPALTDKMFAHVQELIERGEGTAGTGLR